MQYLIALCCRTETASDVVSGRFVLPVVRDKRVKFRDPRLNCSREIPPEAVGGVIYGRLSIVDNFRPEAATDVISGAFVDPIGMKVRVKFDDSRSNHSSDIRLPHLVTTDDDTGVRRSSREGKTP